MKQTISPQIAFTTKLFAVLLPALVTQGCGGSSSGPGADVVVAPGQDASPGEMITAPDSGERPARFLPGSYPEFLSARGVDDLEGTWLVFTEGTWSQQAALVVTGSNKYVEYKYWARSTLRIRRNPTDATQYLIYTCGPGGAGDASTARSGPNTLRLPYFYSSTSSSAIYLFTVVDASTLQFNNAVDGRGGTWGETVRWNLSWLVKRISDDAFANVGSYTDNQTGTSAAAGCLYEAEGTYLVTENDKIVQDVRREGKYVRADAYPRSELARGGYSYSPIGSIEDRSGDQLRMKRSDRMYTDVSGDIVTYSRIIEPTAARYTVTAVNGAIATVSDDVTFSFAP